MYYEWTNCARNAAMRWRRTRYQRCVPVVHKCHSRFPYTPMTLLQAWVLPLSVSVTKQHFLGANFLSLSEAKNGKLGASRVGASGSSMQLAGAGFLAVQTKSSPWWMPSQNESFMDRSGYASLLESHWRRDRHQLTVEKIWLAEYQGGTFWLEKQYTRVPSLPSSSRST